MKYILPIFFFLTGCQSYRTGYFRDASFCQETVGIPTSSYSHRSGFFNEKLGQDGTPICYDQRIGFFKF